MPELIDCEVTTPDGKTYSGTRAFAEAAADGNPFHCEYAAACENAAAVAIPHPILSAVPTCERHLAFVEAHE